MRYGLVLLLALTFACEASNVEGQIVPEGGVDDIAVDAESCDVPDRMGMIELDYTRAIESNVPGSMGALRQSELLGVILDTDEFDTRDATLLVQLRDGFGSFAGSERAAGTYEIAGDDASLDDCGVCVILLATHLYDGSIATLVAQSGIVEVNSIDESMSATVSGLQFQEQGYWDPDESPCSMTIDGMSASAPVEVITGGGGGGGNGDGNGDGTGGS